jgi:hypothetical protein
MRPLVIVLFLVATGCQLVDGDDRSAEYVLERPVLTRADCVGSGGQIIGDPGDGSVHLAGFRCDSGAPPIATVVPSDGEPIAIEGEVCCQ